jgi:eukaryotic-like serine/threonine-protein kinase
MNLTIHPALRLALLLLGAVLAGYAVSMIAYPAPLVSEDQQVPLVVGMPADEAERTLDGGGFRVKLQDTRESDPVLPAGHITWQDPPAFTQAPGGSLIELTVSSGPAPVTVPDVQLFDLDEARRIMGAAGLAVGVIDSVPADAPPGVVVSTRPAVGSPRSPGSPVDLVVSRGPAAVRVPDLSSMAESDARARLDALGLRVGLVRTRLDTQVSPGTVLEQRPQPGVLLPRGGRVDLTVADVRSQ